MREEIERVRTAIEDVCKKHSIDSGNIKILAATKTIAAEKINLLPSMGINLAGENRVQEFMDKYDAVKGLHWHFIGALQTNKVKYVIDKVEMIHSLDRKSLADEIDRQARKMSMVADVLIEVNVGGELSKSGIAPHGLSEFYDYCVSKANLRVRGLMSVLPKSADERLYDELYDLYKARCGGCFDTLSAGMSGDYLTAIAHGANLVRLGSIIFGKRT